MKFIAGLAVGILGVLFLGFLYTQSSRNQFDLSGSVVTEERDVSNFNQVLIKGSGKVKLEQGEEESLAVTTNEELMEYVKTYVSDGKLVLEIDYPAGFGKSPFIDVGVEYDLVVKDLDNLTIDGSGKVEGTKLTTDELDLSINGSGNIAIELEVNKLTSGTSGSGTYELTGVAEDQTVNISGSGKYKGKDLEGVAGTVSIDGSGNVEINASGTLSVDIEGSGKVVYYGEPQIESSNVSGSGSIEKAN